MQKTEIFKKRTCFVTKQAGSADVSWFLKKKKVHNPVICGSSSGHWAHTKYQIPNPKEL